MAFKTKVDINLAPIERRITNQTKVAQNKLIAQAGRDMNKYVPMLTGDLRGSQQLVKDGITWNTVYAKAQFYGTNGRAVFSTYTTAGTGKRLDLKAQGIHGKSWEQLVKECY